MGTRLTSRLVSHLASRLGSCLASRLAPRLASCPSSRPASNLASCFASPVPYVLRLLLFLLLRSLSISSQYCFLLDLLSFLFFS